MLVRFSGKPSDGIHTEESAAELNDKSYRVVQCASPEFGNGGSNLICGYL
jgi:hypothetical protein